MAIFLGIIHFFAPSSGGLEKKIIFGEQMRVRLRVFKIFLLKYALTEILRIQLKGLS